MGAFATMAEPRRTQGATAAVQHGLAWLVCGNAIGVMIAVLLLIPQFQSEDKDVHRPI